MSLSEQNIRGIKRRRRNDKELEDDKEAKLRRKLHHALRALHKIAKKAKTFEVQKTLKKLKDARCKDPKSDLTKDLGAQMEILKRLSCDQLAHSALMTKLKKNKILSADPSIRALSAELSSNLVPLETPGTLTAKVQSRILSSKVIASEVVLIMENLKAFLNPFVGSENVGGAAHNHHSSLNNSKRRRTGVDHEKDASSPKDKPSGQGSKGEYEDISTGEAMAEMDDDWESGTVDGSSGSEDSVAGSADDHDDASFNQGSSDSGDPAGNLKKSWQSHGSKSQSEFLPSLSVGFTRGDSGSEFSDSETRLVDGIKKNRRGQRARRAIWEKKFGKNANHVKKHQEQAAVTSRRRVRGSIPLDRRSGMGNSSRPYPTPARSAYDHQQVRRASLPVSGRINNSAWTRSNDGDVRGKQDRPLHPSWEAKRKHKAASIVVSQGTKIVFSES